MWKTLTTTMIAGLAIGTAGAALGQTAGQTTDPDYCAEGFWRADANADDIISADEARAAGDAVFAAMDQNGDGMVSQTEYQECRGAWMANVSAPEAMSEDDLAALDGDGDGAMAADDYSGASMEAWEGATRATGTQNTSAGGSSTASDATATTGDSAPVVLFRRFILVPADGQRGATDMTREEAANRSAMRFMMLDSNRDDRVDAQEWAQQESLKNDLSEVINQQFEEADADASGDLTQEEMRGAAERRVAEAMARAEEAGEGSDVGAPVVYFVYPHPM